jgi:1,4-dihydroxy-2-naphthoyl-CoA synthase
MDQKTQPQPAWTTVPGHKDILYAKADEGIAKITINRPRRFTSCRPRSPMHATIRTSAS